MARRVFLVVMSLLLKIMQLHFVMTFSLKVKGENQMLVSDWMVYIWKRDSFILEKELFGPFLGVIDLEVSNCTEF